MSPADWTGPIKKRNSELRSPTEQAVFPMGTPTEQNSKNADQQNFASAKEQTSAPTEPQFFVAAKEQNDKSANQQNSADAKTQNDKYANLRRITFHIPEDLFKQLKLIAVEEDLTMLEIGAQMATEYINRKRENKE